MGAQLLKSPDQLGSTRNDPNLLSVLFVYQNYIVLFFHNLYEL